MTHARAQRSGSATRVRLSASIAWFAALATSAHAAQVVIDGPVGSGEFGRTVTILPNGNIVVTDPGYDAPGPIANVGAVYLFRPDGSLVSILRGSNVDDGVGGRVTVLADGNFVIASPTWDNGASANAGAVTYASSTQGVSGVVSPSNSLVGSSSGDLVGSIVTALSNGSYAVRSPTWSNGALQNAGAVSFMSGSGARGVVSDANSLVGGVANAQVGEYLWVLANGNYLVHIPLWNDGAVENAGALTFGSGMSGVSGVVSASNSLVGSTSRDMFGARVTALPDGGFVVGLPEWDNGTAIDAGAASFGSSTGGISGVLSASNSLIGSSAFDEVGRAGVIVLPNGNFIVPSPKWDNGAMMDAGAVTFGSSASGVAGVISSANSLIGSSAFDTVGNFGITVLSTGNYVVAFPGWNNGSLGDAGAVAFGSGITGVSGVISPSNALVGGAQSDAVGRAVYALSNGNYVVASPRWANGGISGAGAVTLGSGEDGTTGVVTPGNSLIGTRAGDEVGGGGVTALSNGNYVVSSPLWDSVVAADVGAVTFGSGSSGVVGIVTPANSLVGSTAMDQVGSAGSTALSNGNYVVLSPRWTNGAAALAGAVTFGSGSDGVNGVVTAGNSLVGGTAGDSVGGFGVAVLTNGGYVARSLTWNNGSAAGAGAATFGSGNAGVSGLVSSDNSLVGSSTSDQVGRVVRPLDNGNYVVGSFLWDNGSIQNAGAATFGSGTVGVSGVISAANSLVGASPDDKIGFPGLIALSTGGYLVHSLDWDNGTAIDAGAVTFGSGTVGINGTISPQNSLVGSRTLDQIGNFIYPSEYGLTAMANGNYLVRSNDWDNGTILDVGAITLGLSDGSVSGPVTNTHSVIGAVINQGVTQVVAYDAWRNQLVVGQRISNRVVLHRSGLATVTTIVGHTPNPSIGDEPVRFTAAVSAIPAAPANGRVTFHASSGESCVANTPTTATPTTVEFSCEIIFAAGGTTTVVAEFTGSLSHAYSASPPEPHTTSVGVVFANSFESP